MRSKWTDQIDRWLEQRCLASANHVIAVSPGIAAFLKGKEHGAAEVSTIMNGIDSLRPTTPHGQGNTCRIVYSGTISYGRDPRPLMQAMARLKREDRLPASVMLEFYGNCRWFNTQSLEQLVHDLDIEGFVTFHDWVSREVVGKAIGEADILLLLAQQQPAQIPHKLYEYLGTRKPVLAFVDEGGDSHRILEAVGGHYIVTDPNSESGQQKINGILLGTSPQTMQDELVLTTLTSDSQMNKLAEIVSSLGGSDLGAGEALRDSSLAAKAQ
jgi:glycosyltransferase involved in cell wall biosynthesis